MQYKTKTNMRMQVNSKPCHHFLFTVWLFTLLLLLELLLLPLAAAAAAPGPWAMTESPVPWWPSMNERRAACSSSFAFNTRLHSTQERQ